LRVTGTIKSPFIGAEVKPLNPASAYAHGLPVPARQWSVGPLFTLVAGAGLCLVLVGGLIWLGKRIFATYLRSELD